LCKKSKALTFNAGRAVSFKSIGKAEKGKLEQHSLSGPINNNAVWLNCNEGVKGIRENI
jgi:hypothetical protein